MIVEDSSTTSSHSLKFDSIFNQSFGPSVLLFPPATLATRLDYMKASPSLLVHLPVQAALGEVLNHMDVNGPFLIFTIIALILMGILRNTIMLGMGSSNRTLLCILLRQVRLRLRLGFQGTSG